MRITYRNQDNKAYWTKRWSDIPPDQPMTNENTYPLKYALETVTSTSGKILEAGCGAGRIVRYFHERGYDIVGIDFVSVAVKKLKSIDPSLQVEEGDITKLKFPDCTFRHVLAFGLYHNLEQDLDRAVAETYRVLEQEGTVCASFRADNLQNRLSDWLAHRKGLQEPSGGRKVFHKRNLTLQEFERLFERAGFVIQSIYPVQNMPLLYKFALFRSSEHKIFDENRARKEGYRLSGTGQWLQSFLMRFFPNQFCNIYVIIAQR